VFFSFLLLAGTALAPPDLFGSGTAGGDLLGESETDGLAVDFTAATPDLLIRDNSATLNYSGTPFLNDGGKLTFSRTSLATVVDDDGLIKWCPHNLCLQSAQIDTSGAPWNLAAASQTLNNAVAPDGSTTADTLTFSDTNSITRQSVTSLQVGTSYTASVYVKAAASGSATHFRLTSNNQSAWDTGASSKVLLTSSWQLVTITWTQVTTTNAYIMLGGNTVSGFKDPDCYGAVDIWGAHLYRSDLGGMQDNGTAFPTYNPTTSAAYYGPRIDHDPVTPFAKRGLLMEEARTNLFLRSQEFENAAWGRFNSTPSANSVTAPDGTTTADTLTASAVTNVSSIYNSSAISITPNADYSLSCYVKKNTHRYVSLVVQSSTLTNRFVTAVFDLDGGGSTATQTAVGSTSGTLVSTSMTSVGNGWYRLTVVGRQDSAAVFAVVQFVPAATGNTFSNTGDVNSATWAGTESIYLWGAQLEAGSFPTSYIPTTTASVTRAADACSIATSLFPYSASTQTFIGHISGTNADNRWVEYDNGGASNYMYASYKDFEHLVVVSGGSIVANIDFGSIVKSQANKVGIALAVNDFAAGQNGGSVSTDTSGAMPAGTTATNVKLGGSGFSSICLNGHIRQFTYLPRRITNAELQARTA
jgi:hypothetical protein